MPAPNEIDELLTRFFQAEVPKTWPDAPVVASVRPLLRSRPVDASRWTLAASIAVLMGLGLWLSKMPYESVQSPANLGLLNKSSANGHELIKRVRTTPTAP